MTILSTIQIVQRVHRPSCHCNRPFLQPVRFNVRTNVDLDKTGNTPNHTSRRHKLWKAILWFSNYSDSRAGKMAMGFSRTGTGSHIVQCTPTTGPTTGMWFYFDENTLSPYLLSSEAMPGLHIQLVLRDLGLFYNCTDSSTKSFIVPIFPLFWCGFCCYSPHFRWCWELILNAQRNLLRDTRKSFVHSRGKHRWYSSNVD